MGMNVVSFNIFRVFVLSLIIFIMGCGGEDAFNGGGCNAADTTTVTHSFSVVGAFTDAGVEVINDTGDFTLSWDLTSSCTYTYEIFLAAGNFQHPTDISIATGTCGLGYSCSYDADLSCSFDGMNKIMSCNGGADVDVSVLLPDPGPVTPYFILVAANEMMDSDVTISEQVRIEF